jgi:hypothetical protein
MTITEAHAEVNYGWAHSYSPEAIASAVDSIADKPLGNRINIFLARMCFRGIYFPMLGKRAWLKLIVENRGTIYKLMKEGFGGGRGSLSRSAERLGSYAETMAPTQEA